MEEKFVDNNGVLIHYIVSNKSSEYPVIFIPGAISGAEDLYEGVKNNLDFFSIFISIRGRGKSSSPLAGYTKEDQVSDIEAVVKKEKLEKFYIFGHSFGVSLASAYSIKHPDKILGLMLADFPPLYPKYSEKWAEHILQNFEGVNTDFVKGIVKDACREDFSNELAKQDFRILFIKAANESLLKEENITSINNNFPDANIVTVNSGHEMFYENPVETLKIIREFVKSY